MYSSDFYLSERELIRRYEQGSEVCFEELMRRNKDRLYAYIYVMVRDKVRAEDVFQETMVKAIRTIKKGSYNDEGKFLPWLMRIAHNQVIDNYRRNKKMPRANGGEDFDIFDTIKHEDPNVEQEMVQTQIVQDVRKLIRHLPDEQKEVLIMRHYKKMSFKEIAELTNVSINTALGRMRYALINLRKLVEKHNIDLTLR